jgi:Fe2+ transport system protein B
MAISIIQTDGDNFDGNTLKQLLEYLSTINILIEEHEIKIMKINHVLFGVDDGGLIEKVNTNIRINKQSWREINEKIELFKESRDEHLEKNISKYLDDCSDLDERVSNLEETQRKIDSILFKIISGIIILNALLYTFFEIFYPIIKKK